MVAFVHFSIPYHNEQAPSKRRVYKAPQAFQQPLDHSIRRQQLEARLQKVRNRTKDPRSRRATTDNAMVVEGGAGGTSDDRAHTGIRGGLGDSDMAVASMDSSFGGGAQSDQLLPESPSMEGPLSAPFHDLFPFPDTETAPEIQEEQSEPSSTAKTNKTRKQKMSKADKRAKAQASFHKRWTNLLPSLVAPFLDWTNATTAQTVPSLPASLTSRCNKKCPKKTVSIACLFQNHHEHRSVQYCSCEPVAVILVQHGLFPCAPSQPKQAIHIPLLDFYQALFERSCDAVNALVSALSTHYTRRGFPVRHSNGTDIKDAFRKGVTAAVSWYDHLHRVIEEAMHAAILESNNPQPAASSTEGEAAQYLKQKCPACFGGKKYGNKQNSDVHVCVDGNFNHRHLREAGDSPHLHIPEYYVSKADVDEVGDRIDSARKRPPKPRQVVVPDEAVDECEEGHIAGTGTNVKTSGERYDDTGNMALVCRHDIPLFLANIDTPGEQQKYAVALIQKLFSMLPSNAYVAVFYDIGCVLDRSLHTYDILPTNIVDRLTISTSIMHAYGHQWSCQLVYNPRLRENLGMTDGEGTERFWSRTRKIISVTRTSGRTRRLWLIDRLTARIGSEMRDGLGDWMKRRLKNVEAQEAEAKKKLKQSGVPESELRQLWQEQRAAQISLRNHAPARLKKDLEKVLAIQADLDRIDETIRLATSILGSGPEVAASLKQMSESHESFSAQVDDLYSSLNILDSFEGLRGLPFSVVHKLLLARDLKVNIRKRAIGSFFEYDKLEQAAGGRDQVLGTKLHQATRAAITKRKPAFLSAIRRYNKYCDELKVLLDAKWGIPVPKPLPTTIHQLKEASHLMEDVWIEPSTGPIPRWLESLDVREGIRAMLKLDRCKEERLRLGHEADNMCRWFGKELKNAHLALSHSSNQRIRCQLQQYCSRLLQTEHSWASSPFASKSQYQFHVAEAVRASAHPGHENLTWIRPMINHNPTLELDAIEESGSESDSDGELLGPEPMTDDEDEVTDYIDPEDILQQQIAEDEVDSYADDDPGWAPITVDWRAPSPLTHDPSLLTEMDHPSLEGVPAVHSFRKLPTRPYLRSGYIEHIFHQSPSAAQCAIFSSFDIHLARYDQPSDEVWRRTRVTEYWRKTIWIIPVYLEGLEHWTVAVVYPSTRRVLLYDSLAFGYMECRETFKEIAILIDKLVTAATEHGYSHLPPVDSRWVGNPFLVQSAQTSTYSCGLWVLALVAAIIRGYHLPGLGEHDLERFRNLLYWWTLTLPLAS
ncbi:hypothetical protein MD484_g3033, partial [Candolleomyces efflorescens]